MLKIAPVHVVFYLYPVNNRYFLQVSLRNAQNEAFFNIKIGITLYVVDRFSSFLFHLNRFDGFFLVKTTKIQYNLIPFRKIPVTTKTGKVHPDCETAESEWEYILISNQSVY